MRILLLRHADAVPVAATDAARALSVKGVEQAERVGRFLQREALEPDLILTSPLVRAKQTAELAAARLEVRPRSANWLAAGMGPEQATDALCALDPCDLLLLVGHEPDFGLLAAHLLGLPGAGRLHVRKASLLCLSLETPRPGCACLEFSIPVKFL